MNCYGEKNVGNKNMRERLFGDYALGLYFNVISRGHF